MGTKGNGKGPAETSTQPANEREEAFVVRNVGEISTAGLREELERLLNDPTFFRTLADSMPDVGFIVDLGGNFVYTSAAAERLTGYSPERLKKMNMADIVTPELLSQLQERMQGRIRGEDPGEMEFEVVSKDGTTHIVELRTAPIVDEQGRLLGVHGIARDITDRRRAEQESERRAEYLRALAELSKLLLEPRDTVPIVQAFGILGKAAHVRSVQLFEHVLDEEGDINAVRRVAWCSDIDAEPENSFTLFTWGAKELETLENTIGKTGTFSGSPATIFGDGRVPGPCPKSGSIAVIALSDSLEEDGFVVFEDRNENRVWSDWELDFLKTGTHLIGQALVRTRMRRDEQLLAGFGEAVAEVDSRERLAAVLNTYTREHFGWDAFVLALRSIAPGQPDFLYLVDTDEEGRQVEEHRDWWTPESLGPRAKGILAGQSLLINRKHSKSATPLVSFGYKGRKSASLIFVPIAGRDQVEGMISVQSYSPFAYRKEDLRCLERLAGIAALVLSRLRTQAALHKTEEQFRNIADMVDAYIWSAEVKATHPEWRVNYTLYTSGVERITGVPTEEFLKHDRSLWLQMIHEADHYLVAEALERLARGEKVTSVYRIQRPDGEVRWVRDSVVPTVDAQGNVVRLDGLCLDVTEEQKVAQERDRLFEAVDRAAEAIVLLGPSAVVEYTNKTFTELTGITAEEARGKRWHELVLFDKDLDRQQSKLLHALRTRGFWMGRTTMHRAGKSIPIEVIASAVREEDGTIRHWVLTIRDISERVALEEQLRQSQKLEALGTLAAGIAHDFNNLLTGILGNIELAALEAPAELQEYFDDARRVARRAADLVRQLLAFARKAPGTKQPLALGPVIKETTKLLAETTDRRISVEADVPPDLWVVEGDPVQMQQLIMNLCVNARDALMDCLAGAQCRAAKNKEPLAIHVAAGNLDAHREPLPFPGAPKGAYVKLTVSDNGPGMSEETKSRIFEPFFTTKEVGKGTGLGLSTVYGIVTQHGGYIRVNSEPGQGTVFEVFLPAVQETTPSVTGTETLPLEAPKQVGVKRTILLVDDEDSVRSYVAQVLRRAGYRVIEASNGREGIKTFQRHRDEIDLTVLDLIMPVMGGEETLAAIRELQPDAKVMMLSGTWDASLLRRLKQSGVAYFLEKPPEMGSLLQSIRKVLEETDEGAA